MSVYEVRRICHLLPPDALSRGADHLWIYRPGKSGDTNTSALDSTVGARCVYTTADDGYELAVTVMITPASASTILQDLGCCASWASVTNLGDEAYIDRIGGSGSGFGELYARGGDTWYEVEMTQKTSADTGVDGGTRAELTAIMGTVVSIHPQFS